MNKIVLHSICCFLLQPLKGQTARITYSEADRLSILEAHNVERRLVGNADLVWDYQLEEFAADWASTIAQRGQLSHRPNNSYGENCYMTTGTIGNQNQAILAFNGEKSDYVYGPVSSSNWYGTGHYTQVIWYKTTRVGCATVKGSSGSFVVCNYDPPGNLMGDYPYKKSASVMPGVSQNSQPRQTASSFSSSGIQAGNSQPITKQQTGSSLSSSNVKGPSSSVANTTSSGFSKTATGQNQSPERTFVWILTGIESWSRYQSYSIFDANSMNQTRSFSGSTPVMELCMTMPKKSTEQVKKIRGIVGLGMAMPTSKLTEDLKQSVQSPSPNALNYDNSFIYSIGLNCWDHIQLSGGEFMFGNPTTSDPFDYNSVFRSTCRIYFGLGPLNLALNVNFLGESYDPNTWNMGSVGLSLKATYF